MKRSSRYAYSSYEKQSIILKWNTIINKGIESCQMGNTHKAFGLICPGHFRDHCDVGLSPAPMSGVSWVPGWLDGFTASYANCPFFMERLVLFLCLALLEEAVYVVVQCMDTRISCRGFIPVHYKNDLVWVILPPPGFFFFAYNPTALASCLSLLGVL